MSLNPKSANNTEYNLMDLNNYFSYDNLKYQLDADEARIKQVMIVINGLRIEAAEMVADNAAMYHTGLWKDAVDLKKIIEEKFNNL